MTLGPLWAGLTQFSFGDSPNMATRLAALVVTGVKTASCSAAVHGPDTQIGERQVCLNGDGNPVCVVETVGLTTLSFNDVTPAMAALEGEGDLSYSYWREAHIEFYKREGTWSEDMDLIFETFRCVAILDDGFATAATGHVEAERREAHAAGYTALGQDGREN